MVWGCGVDPPTPVETRVSEAAIASTAVLGSIEFGGGVRLDAIDVAPGEVQPGETVTVRFELHGPPLDLEVALWPPGVLGRQVALGGPDAPSPERPVDARVQRVALDRASGVISAVLHVPQPWHPATAIVTVAHRPRGEAPRVAVTRGPRTHDRIGVLAVLDVTPMPVRVVARRVPEGLVLDGRLDDAFWSTLEPVALVMLPSGDPASSEWRTEVRLGWNGAGLVVGADLRDADLWATLHDHDAKLWDEDVFEVFVFSPRGPDRYLEFQVSPRGTTFDARFPTYRRGETGWSSTWNPVVSIDGTLDTRRDQDRGWTLETIIPWDEICTETQASCPPHLGMSLRLNMFRFERSQDGTVIALGLSPPRVPDFHAATYAAVVELTP